MHKMHNYTSSISNKAKLELSFMILVNNSSCVKYKVIDASARFFILERISFPDTLQKEAALYLNTLVCITPEEFMRDFHLEGDLYD